MKINKIDPMHDGMLLQEDELEMEGDIIPIQPIRWRSQLRF